MELGPSSDVLSIIRGFYSSLSVSETKVADYILANLHETIRMTLADVGHESGVSDATVLRFCRSIGYKRWLEFKVDLIRTLPSSPEQILDDVNGDDPPGMIAKKVFNCSIQALTDTLSELDDANFVQALELIADAERILIIGVGTSGSMANEMHNRLLRLGLNCHVQTDSYIQVMESALLTADEDTLMADVREISDKFV